MMHNQRLDERVYGAIPDTFDTFLTRTLQAEPQPKRMPKPRLVLIMALAILLLAGTALAVAQRLQIINLFGIGSVNEIEAEKVIATSIAQTGGITDIADFTVTEAYYDGSFVRFVIDSQTKHGAVLRNAAFAMLKEEEGTAGLPGDRYGVTASVASPQVERFSFIAMGHANGSLYLYTNDFLRENLDLESIDFTVSIDITDIDDGSPVDSCTLDFTIDRTATPLTTAYDLATGTDYVRLEQAIVAQTPLETAVSLTYRPLLRAFREFTVVPSDGYVVKDNSMYRFGNVGTLPDRDDGGKTTMTYMLPVEQGAENVLMLWITSTDQAIEIDLDTGVATACTVQVIATENNVKIEKVED